MARIDAVDISNWSIIPTQEHFDRWRELGVRRVIVGASFGIIARQQVEACLAAGFEVEIYAWINFTDWVPGLANAYRVIAGLPVNRVWLDMEQDTLLAPEQIIVLMEKAILPTLRDWRPDVELGVYTAAWWWRFFMRDSGWDFGLPLWLAWYVDPDANNLEDGLIGGWALHEIAIWQYTGSIDTGGVNTDRNLIVEAPMVTDKRFNEVAGNLLSALGRQGGQIEVIGNALFDHVQHHPVGTPSSPADEALEAQFAELKAQFASFKADAVAAAKILAGT